MHAAVCVHRSLDLQNSPFCGLVSGRRELMDQGAVP